MFPFPPLLSSLPCSLTYLCRAGAISNESSVVTLKVLPSLIRLCKRKLDMELRAEATGTLGRLVNGRVFSLSPGLAHRRPQVFWFDVENLESPDILIWWQCSVQGHGRGAWLGWSIKAFASKEILYWRRVDPIILCLTYIYMYMYMCASKSISIIYSWCWR